jgi:hypothetical protein
MAPISQQKAEKVWGILADVCGAKSFKNEFIQWATNPNRAGNEFRFGGISGMAGKVWIEPDGIRVSGPNDVELKQVHNPDELVQKIRTANLMLKEIGTP